MSITDELRESIKQTCWAMTSKAKWFAIADRIDANHISEVDQTRSKAWNEGFDEGFASADDLSTASEETMAKHGWIRGPLDADGIMWHEGDMSDSVWGEIELIVRDVDGHWYIKGHDTTAQWVRADSMRHHHEPTVEDVLREFALEIDPSADIAVTGAETIKKFAAKLQLKEPSE